MSNALRRTVLFALERLLVRGAHYRFLFVVAIIGLVSIVGGVLVMFQHDDTFQNVGEATWWAFLRLSDPGYLGDDEGLWKRIVSTVLTVLGYVVFLGAMVAILTQWLNSTLERLELGLTPIRMNRHIVLVGWTNRTAIICRDLFFSEGRLQRWLRFSGVRRLRIAILSNNVGPRRVQELKDALGRQYHRGRLILRSGSPLNTAALSRVDLAHAASVVIPGVEATSAAAEVHDDAVIKTLCVVASISNDVELLPPCVCEIFDSRKVSVAKRAYPGIIEVVASDVMIGRLLAYSAREPGLANVCNELLTHGEGATFYILPWEAPPTTFGEVHQRVGGAIVLGFVRSEGRELVCRLCPSDTERVEAGDNLVVAAHAYDDVVVGPAPAAPAEPEAIEILPTPPVRRRILLLGWSRRAPDLLKELARMPGERSAVTVLSAVSVRERQEELDAHDCVLTNLELEHHEGEITVPPTLKKLDPAGFDRIILLASDWLSSGGASDARSISAYHAVGELLEGDPRKPTLVVELSDPQNVDLFDRSRTEVVVSPQVLSHLLAQILLRRDLRSVVDDVFGSGPSNLRFAKVSSSEPVAFETLSRATRAQGSIAIGLRRGGVGGEIALVPSGTEMIDGRDGDELIVLSTEPSPSRSTAAAS